MSAPSDCYLIVTADDFGASVAGVKRILQAHACGVLTSASLMVAEPAASDAVKAARAQPALAVGLHLTLCDGRAAQSHAEAPGLVDRRGMLRSSPAIAGLAYAMRAPLRAQIRVEIARQFDAFSATGLPCDHVDGHHHLHVHPVAWREILALAPRLGADAVRTPVEQGTPFHWRQSRTSMDRAFLRAISTWCMRSARRAGLRVPDRVLGIADSGRLSEEHLVSLLRYAVGGVTELYLHPGNCAPEALALCAGPVREEIGRLGLRRAPWRDIPGVPH